MWFLKRTPLEDEHFAVNIAAIGMIFGFLGARLLHVIYEEPRYYIDHPLKIFEVWNGGFVYYGGLLLGLAAAALYIKKLKLKLPRWLDRASLPLGLAYIFGRVGCFLNGCCYGKYCSLPWAVSFPSHSSLGIAVVSRHPTQLYAVAFEGLSILLLIQFEKQKISTASLSDRVRADARYSAPSGIGSTANFVESMYRDLSAKK